MKIEEEELVILFRLLTDSAPFDIAVTTEKGKRTSYQKKLLKLFDKMHDRLNIK